MSEENTGSEVENEVPNAVIQNSTEAEQNSDSENTSGAVEQAHLNNLQDDSAPRSQHDELNTILDIPISLSVEIGQTKISIRNLLQLNQGSVVELDRLAGEPLDVMVNNTLVAHGEIVVVNEKYGIRLTDVVSALERVKNLQ